MQSRRSFIRSLLGMAVLVAVPVACGASESKPVPFETGQEVNPPLGCSELRERDRRGDC